MSKKKNKKKLKLNLGCGSKLLDGYINVDKYGTPDMVVDLEQTPWPWKKNSVKEVNLIHVLEHLGSTTDIFLKIMQELYRVCCNGAIINIKVPHHRSDAFFGDPTHVRAITPAVLELFSKKRNIETTQKGYANTTLALFLDVDFEIIDYKIDLLPTWAKKYESKEITFDELNFALTHYYNVVNQLNFILQVIK